MRWISHVYEEVKDHGQKVVSVRWVITQKFKNNEIRYKAAKFAAKTIFV